MGYYKLHNSCLPKWLLMALALSLSSCSPTVDVDYSKSREVCLDTTFDILPEVGYERHGRAAQDVSLYSSIATALVNSLQKRGLIFQQKPKPQLYVSFHYPLEKEITGLELNRFYSSAYGHRKIDWEDWTNPGEIDRKFAVGSLVIDIIDAQDRVLIWRGYTNAKLEDLPMDNVTIEDVREVVERIISNLNRCSLL